MSKEENLEESASGEEELGQGLIDDTYSGVLGPGNGRDVLKFVKGPSGSRYEL